MPAVIHSESYEARPLPHGSALGKSIAAWSWPEFGLTNAVHPAWAVMVNGRRTFSHSPPYFQSLATGHEYLSLNSSQLFWIAPGIYAWLKKFSVWGGKKNSSRTTVPFMNFSRASPGQLPSHVCLMCKGGRKEGKKPECWAARQIELEGRPGSPRHRM